VLAAMQDGAAIFDADCTTVVEVNAALEKLTGRNRDELIGSIEDHPFWSSAEDPDLLAVLHGVRDGDYTERELAFDRKDGTRFTALLSPACLKDEEGRPVRCFMTVKDITKRKEEEAQLRQSRRNLQLVMDTIPQRVFWKDRNFKYLGCNQVFAEDAGLASPREIIGKNDFELSWKETAPLYRSDDREVMEKDISKINYEEPQARADGSQLWLRTTKIPIKNERGEIVGVFGSYEDITDKKLAEDSLRKSEERYRSLVEHASDGIYLIDSDGNFLDVKTGGLELLGYSRDEILRLNTADIIDPVELKQQPLRFDKLTTGTSLTIERHMKRKDGSFIPVEISVRQLPDGRLLGIVRDISERKRAEDRQRILEAQLRQSQKMEALGTLAGGIAHDFNNILTVIMGYAQLLHEDLSPDDPRTRDLDQLLQASDRGRQLVRRILAYSRADEPKREFVCLERVLGETVKLLRATLPATIELRTNIQDCEGVVLSTETDIHQLVVNLATNAAHAMHESGGVLEIGLVVENHEKPIVHHHGDLAPGRYFRLHVSDTGVGIAADCIDRIFDPFFTTKIVGQGTGLGLSVVHGIVMGLGGAVTVESKPGSGTRFDVYFPWFEGEESTDKEEAGDEISGTERVLLVDDEPQLVDLGTRMLEKKGYRVVAFTDPGEALSAYGAAPDDFDVVVTDFTMPHRTGLDVARHVSSIREDMPIVLMTGFGDGLTWRTVEQEGISALVMKPYRSKDLARAVRTALAKKNR
jgi:PAS domain S-box-containing protein